MMNNKKTENSGMKGSNNLMNKTSCSSAAEETVGGRYSREEKLQKGILEHLQQIREPKDAETLWLNLKTKGYMFSISSFYNRLKKMSEEKLISKSEKDEKAVYWNMGTEK